MSNKRAVDRAWENAGNEKSICEIFFLYLPSLKLSIDAIMDRLEDIGSDYGFLQITKHRERGGGKADLASVTFGNEGMIYFDGKDWCYRLFSQ
jgi:hypothetical protein